MSARPSDHPPQPQEAPGFCLRLWNSARSLQSTGERAGQLSIPLRTHGSPGQAAAPSSDHLGTSWGRDRDTGGKNTAARHCQPWASLRPFPPQLPAQRSLQARFSAPDPAPGALLPSPTPRAIRPPPQLPQARARPAARPPPGGSIPASPGPFRSARAGSHPLPSLAPDTGHSSPQSSGSGGDGRRKAGGRGDSEGGARHCSPARGSLGHRVPPLAPGPGIHWIWTTSPGRPWGETVSGARRCAAGLAGTPSPAS